MATGLSFGLGDPGGPNNGNQVTNRLDGEYTGRRLPVFMDATNSAGQLQVLRLQGANGQPLPANPFLLRRSVEAFLGGIIDGASKENRGASYVLKVRSKTQYAKLLTMSQLADGTPVTVVEHPHLNVVKCVVSCYDAIDLPDDYLLDELRSQGIREIYRIKKRTPDGKLVNTPAIVLTITGTVIPEHITFGWTRCPTRNYYPNPMRCYRCWDFGHTGKRCPSSEEVCGNCSKQHRNSSAMNTDDNTRPQCTEQQYCKFCRTNEHPTSSRKCPAYKKETEVQRLKVDRGLSYPQARREVEALQGSSQVSSYAKTTTTSKDAEIEELRKKVSELTTANSGVSTRLATVQKSGTIEDLVQKIAKLTEQIGKMQDNLNVKDQIIEKLRTQVKQSQESSVKPSNKNVYNIFSSDESDITDTPAKQTPKRDRTSRDSGESSDSAANPKSKRGAIPKTLPTIIFNPHPTNIPSNGNAQTEPHTRVPVTQVTNLDIPPTHHRNTLRPYTQDNGIRAADGHPSSRGPASADVTPQPELADNPRRSDAIPAITDQASSRDFVGVKRKAVGVLGTPHLSPTDDAGCKNSQAQSPSAAAADEAFSPLGPEATSAELYDILHKKRYGSSATILPGPSRRSCSPPEAPVADQGEGPASGGALGGSTPPPNPWFNTTFCPSPPPSPPVVGSGPATPANRLPVPSNPPLQAQLQSRPPNARKTTLALQWNINGYYNNLCDLELLVSSSNPVAIALQEIHRTTPAAMNRTLGSRYKWFTKMENNVYRSAAVGVLQEIPATEIPIDADFPIVAVRIEWPTPTTIVSIYIPSGKFPNLKNKLVSTFESLPTPAVILGDINGHHQSWGSRTSNARGKVIFDAAADAGFAILNDGTPTFRRGSQESAVDITMASSGVLGRLLWSTDGDPRGSDHSPILVALDSTPTNITRRPRWKYGEADWGSFQREIERELPLRPDQSISEISNIILQAAEGTIPRTSPNPGRKAVHWWSDTTKKAVKARRKALRALKKAKARLPANDQRLDEIRSKYQTARNDCRQTLRDTKDKAWVDFLDGINPDQSSTELWRRINAFQGKRRANGITLSVNGVTHRDPEVVADALADHFHRQSSFLEYPEDFRKKHPAPTAEIASFQVPPDNGNDINRPFTMAELDFALQKGSGKSAGPDGTGYQMYRNLPPCGKAAFLKAINQEWINGTFPAEWRTSLVVPIPKSQGPANEAGSYRPIALTNVGSKIMERMVNRRLTHFLETSGKINHRQHAFRSGRGTGTYLASLGQILEEAKTQDKHVELVSLDISRAYNRAWTPGVLKKLALWGVSGNLLTFIKNFLIDRSFRVLLGNHTSKSMKEETGVPQGSVIAVTLFLVAMEEVFAGLPKDIYILVYADDILLIAVGKHPRKTQRKVQAAVNKVAKWSQSVGFTMSAGKCVRTHICQVNHRPPGRPIVLNGSTIPTKNSVRLLGITVDRRLTFVEHCRTTKEACKVRSNMIKLVSRRRSRSDRALLLRVVDAVITSRLTYGLELTSINLPEVTSSLAPVYNRAVRLVSGHLPSTPADIACAEAGAMPFRHKIVATLSSKTIGYLEKSKVSDGSCHLLDRANESFQKTTQQQLPKITGLHRLGPRNWSSTRPKIDHFLKAQLRRGADKHLAQALFAQRISEKYPDHLIRYTDGSKAAGKVGLGIESSDGFSESHRLPDASSVFSAEAAAIFRAVTLPSDKPILIVTDSASVLAALNSDNNRHPYVQAIQENLSPNITLMWVPGHSGISGNESADVQANTGRYSPFLVRCIPAADAKLWTKQQVTATWAGEWKRQRNICRMAKNSILPGEDLPNRREQVVLSRMRTGHTKVTHNFGPGDFHTHCTTCNCRITIQHILNSCPLYHEPRITYQIINAATALQNDRVSEQLLINFLKDCRLYDKI